MTREQVAAREDNWKYRRAMSFFSVGSLLAMLTYLTVFGESENLVQGYLAQSLPLGVIGIIITYVGGPIADDWLQLRLNRS